MEKLSGNAIRQQFLDFFKSKQHRIVKSDSLIPEDGSTLFTTAGMQQFKPQFMGQITDYTRATTSQKCLRTDDLDEVGETDFHHTFFEMLGNFSFGDYFKKEAIMWAWEFLTDVLGIPPNKLWVSVHHEDDEAYQIWLNEINIPAERIVKLGDKDNFWPANARENGPNGPCGPCSEIFYDWGAKPELNNEDDNPGHDQHGRFCEVWNLVFTQYNRQDGGVLEPLPSQNIDTGMGLERLTAVIQGQTNNFNTDLFTPILNAIRDQIPGLMDKQQRVMADHLRAICFSIADGIVPSNKEHGSVVKKLIDTCSVIAFYQGFDKPVVYTLVSTVIDLMGRHYPELIENQKVIQDNIKHFETLNLQKIVAKLPLFEEEIQGLTGQGLGELVFVYHDTHGLTLDIMQRAMKKAGVSFDHKAQQAYEARMIQQKELARASSKMQGDVFAYEQNITDVPKTIFTGYTQLVTESRILKLYTDGQNVDQATQGDQVVVILDKTPFYAESGGQVADTGFITHGEHVLQIVDVQKKNDVFLHTGIVDAGEFHVGDDVTVSVNADRRQAIVKNHTATHLLQAALTQILGEHVKQQGSMVADNRLRFDFTQPKAIKEKQLQEIEALVNDFVTRGEDVHVEELPIEVAKQKGARAYFADKYGDVVRVVSIGDFSIEFCGGTHVQNTADIGAVKVVSQSAVAQGIRRIEAVTGTYVDEYNRQKAEEEQQRAAQQAQKEQAKNNMKQRFLTLKDGVDDIIGQADEISGARVVAHVFDDIDLPHLRQLSDLMKQKAPSCVALLGARTDDTGSLIISVTDDLVKKNIKAGDLVKEVAPIMGGQGGGRPQMAQAGSKHPEKINDVIEKAKDIVRGKLT